MTLAPTEVRYAGGATQATRAARLQINSATGGNRTLLAELAGSPAGFPAGHLAAGSHTITISESSGGTLPPTGSTWGLALVEDDTDVGANGNYSVAGDVISWTNLGLGGSSIVSSVNINVPTSGVYRLVLTAGDTAGRSQNGTGTATGPTSLEFHADSDGNELRGGLAPTRTGIFAVAVLCALATVQALTAPDNQRVAQQPALTLNLDPVGSGTFRETWQVRLAVRVPSSDGAGIKTRDVTPDASGAVVSGTYNVDNQFAATPTDHFLHVGVNATLGNASTPAGQQPGIYSVVTPVGVSASERSWLAFATSGHAAGYTRASASRVFDLGTTTIGSGMALHKAAGLNDPGVLVFNDAARTISNRGFRRPQESGAQDYSHPYLRFWIADAYGAALPSTAVRVEVRRDGTTTSENGQNVSTDANGRVQIDYAISSTHTAFNREKKPRTTVDDPGSAPHTIPTSQIAGYDAARAQAGSAMPVYGKDVWVRDNTFAGVNEPEVTSAKQFGVTSEVFAGGVWFGDNSVANPSNTGPNGRPTATTQGSQLKGVGDLRCKITAPIDSGTLRVLEGIPVLHDWAGRVVDVDNAGTTDYFNVRWGSWDTTAGVAEKVLEDSANNERLQTALAYATQYSTHAEPANPKTLLVQFGFADTTGQRDTFARTNVTNIGFTGDTGLYGYIEVPFAFTKPVLDVFGVVTTEKVITKPGAAFDVRVRFYRRDALLGDAPFPVDPSPAPRLKGYSTNPATGIQEKLFDVELTDLDADQIRWGTTVDLPDNDARVVVMIPVANTAGSPIGSFQTVQVDATRDLSLLPVLLWIPFPSVERHFIPGDPVIASFSLFDATGAAVPDFDDDEASIAVLRITGVGGLEYLESDLSTWSPFVDVPTSYITAPGGSLSIADTSTFNANDLIIIGEGTVLGEVYTEILVLEQVDQFHQHDVEEPGGAPLLVAGGEALLGGGVPAATLGAETPEPTMPGGVPSATLDAESPDVILDGESPEAEL